MVIFGISKLTLFATLLQKTQNINIRITISSNIYDAIHRKKTKNFIFIA